MKRIALQNRNHPGISMHKIPIGADFAGVTFTIGVVTMSLIAIPEVRYFVGLSLACGSAIGAVLWWMHR